MVGAAWERARNHFSPKNIDNLQSGYQMSQPTSNNSHSHHKSRASDSNKDSNPQQIDLNMVMDHVKSLENKIRQESEQLEINRVKHESDLRNMSQQYESQINKLIHTHQQQVSDFEAQIQAKHNEMLALKNQLSAFNSQPHS